jgi:hypothetical protein
MRYPAVFVLHDLPATDVYDPSEGRAATSRSP